jgi:DNA-binding GntR family transcriptional regulator
MSVSGSADEVADALEVRDLLESAVIVSAAQGQYNRAALAPLRDALRAMQRAKHADDFYQRNLDFHVEIAELCENKILGAYYRSLLELVRSHNPHLSMLPGEDGARVRAKRFEIHHAIADAIAAHDVDAADAAAAAHSIHEAGNRLTASQEPT